MSDLIWYWHVHHKVLLEPLTDTAEARRRAIRGKSVGERATRLLWMQPVRDPSRIPEEVVAEAKRYVKDRPDAGSPANCGAEEKLVAAIKRNRVALQALHEEELPGSPWDWDTMDLVFPGTKRPAPGTADFALYSALNELEPLLKAGGGPGRGVARDILVKHFNPVVVGKLTGKVV